MDKIAETSLLYDFYGQLLTEKQRQVMSLYHEENLTLSEIADEFGISRQGVHDALQKGEKALESYEEKLGLVRKFTAAGEAIREIDEKIDILIARADSTGLAEELKKIKGIIDRLEE